MGAVTAPDRTLKTGRPEVPSEAIRTMLFMAVPFPMSTMRCHEECDLGYTQPSTVTALPKAGSAGMTRLPTPFNWADVVSWAEASDGKRTARARANGAAWAMPGAEAGAAVAPPRRTRESARPETRDHDALRADQTACKPVRITSFERPTRKDPRARLRSTPVLTWRPRRTLPGRMGKKW